jgi:hypothetical protein
VRERGVGGRPGFFVAPNLRSKRESLGFKYNGLASRGNRKAPNTLLFGTAPVSLLFQVLTLLRVYVTKTSFAADPKWKHHLEA